MGTGGQRHDKHVFGEHGDGASIFEKQGNGVQIFEKYGEEVLELDAAGKWRRTRGLHELPAISH